MSTDQEIVLREPDVNDAAAIAEFINEHSRSLHGEADLTDDEIRHWFSVDDNLWFLLAERDGRIVGYLDVQNDEGQGTRWEIDARSLEADVAELLLATAEARARAGAAPGAEARGHLPDAELVMAEAYARAGFAPIRSSYQMRIDLPDELPEPAWPEGIAVRPFRPGEEQRVYEAHEESFADHWDHRRNEKDEWRRWMVETPRWDGSLWFVAEEGDEIAALALCSWHSSGDPAFGWVNVLGTRKPWRKRGLGLALLQHSFLEFKRRGATRVGLGVDAESLTGAVRLYERAGMTVARRSDTVEKKLA